MKFQRILVERFGPLEGLEWGGEDPLTSLAVVLGPNEAGKSAFHELLATLLYGFYPATRDANPWAPWRSGDIDIRGQLQLQDGADLEIHRRLLSAPWAQLHRDGTVETIRNDDLPFVRHVHRNVFLQVYALTLAELAGLEGSGWEAVQDRLVVGMGARDIRAPREVIQEWTEAAQGLWRADRRGTPRHRRVREDLQGLRERRREATERDRRVRELERQARELAQDRDQLRGRREELNRHLEVARRLLPLRKRLRRMEELRTRAGDLDELEGLPPEPGTRLEELDDLIRDEEESLERLDGRLEQAGEQAGQLTDLDRALLARSSELRDLAHRTHLLQERAARRGQLEEEIRSLDRRIRETAAPILDAPPSSLSSEILDPLPLPELEHRVEELARARERVARIREDLEAVDARPVPPDPGRLPGMALVPILAGAALLWSGTRVLDPFVSTAGILAGLLLLGGGLGLLLRWWANRGAHRAAREQQERERSALEERLDAGVTELEGRFQDAREPLDGLPLREEIRSRPTTSLVATLTRLRDGLRDREDRAATRDHLVEEDEEVSRELAGIREDLLPDLPSDPMAALPALGARLREVERRAEAARAAAERIQELEEERKPRARRLEELRQQRRHLEEALAAATHGPDPDVRSPEVLQAVSRRLQARTALRREEEELPRDFPDLEELRSRLQAAEEEKGEWLSEDEAADLEAKRREIQERLEEVRGEVAGLTERIHHLAEEETPDVLDGEIQLLEEELARVRVERDRFYVLSRLLARAERRFRDEHQPDVLRRAGEYLARITDERYRRLVLGEGENVATFHLQAPHLPRALPVAFPLSTGTREQVYLALRLAIVDHLDQGREPLPLFLDEVLVNWDRSRRGRGLDVLATVSERRQVFLFTCHPELAEEVAKRGGAVLELEAPARDEKP